MRKLIGFGLLALMLILLAGCMEEAGANQESNEKETTSVEKKEEPTEKTTEKDEKKEEPEPEFKHTYPLTGEPTNDSIDHRAISVMVNNHTKARPQSGLSQADVVYEVLAEGQITRFLALFHSDIPDTIGPVRSARPYYFELAKGYDAVYVYHGASTAINRKVANSGIDYLDGAAYDNNGWLFDRSSERPAPHNSYLLTDGVGNAADVQGYESVMDIDALPFLSEDAGVDGTDVKDVTVTYSERPQEIVSYTYDQEQQQFLRSSDGEPSIDRSNDARLSVDNVFIVKTDHRVIDNAGRRAIDLTSGGNGYLLQKGKIKEVQWKNDDGRILPYKDGEPLAFAQGQTWVNIIPNHATVEATNSSN